MDILKYYTNYTASELKMQDAIGLRLLLGSNLLKLKTLICQNRELLLAI